MNHQSACILKPQTKTREENDPYPTGRKKRRSLASIIEGSTEILSKTNEIKLECIKSFQPGQVHTMVFTGPSMKRDADHSISSGPVGIYFNGRAGVFLKTLGLLGLLIPCQPISPLHHLPDCCCVSSSDLQPTLSLWQ